MLVKSNCNPIPNQFLVHKPRTTLSNLWSGKPINGGNQYERRATPPETQQISHKVVEGVTKGDRNNSIQGSHTRCGDENQDSWATAKHSEVARGKRGRVEKKVVLSPYINSGNKRWELAFIYADAPEARLVLGYFFSFLNNNYRALRKLKPQRIGYVLY